MTSHRSFHRVLLVAFAMNLPEGSSTAVGQEVENDAIRVEKLALPDLSPFDLREIVRNPNAVEAQANNVVVSAPWDG
jgi:hypothetical protein